VTIDDRPRVCEADLVVASGSAVAGSARGRGVLNGSRYYIVDRRLAAVRARRRHRPRRCPRVLVALGGGHHVRRIAGRLVEALRAGCPGAVVTVASGFVPGRAPVLPYARWQSAPRGLVALFSGADVAVVAGGVTLHEACAAGVPAVGLAVVPEQGPAIAWFARQGAVIDAGGPPDSEAATRRAARGVRKLLTNPAAAHDMTEGARRLVDGRGAVRVANRIVQLVAKLRRKPSKERRVCTASASLLGARALGDA